MKRMRRLLAGFLAAAMVITTGFSAQAASFGESGQERMETEAAQDGTAGRALEKTVRENSSRESQKEPVQENSEAEKPEETAQGNLDAESQKEPVQRNSEAENPEETVPEETEDGIEGQSAAYGLPRAGETFTIQNVGTKKYIKTYQASNTPLTVDGEEGDPDIQFKSVIYKTDYLDMLVCNFI